MSSGADRALDAGVDGAGVESLLQRHQADAGDLVAGQDGPLHRRRAPPSGQQGEVEVDHGQRVEHVGLDQPAVGDHHAQLGADAEHVVDLVGDGQAQLEGRRLDRAGHQRRRPVPGGGRDG